MISHSCTTSIEITYEEEFTYLSKFLKMQPSFFYRVTTIPEDLPRFVYKFKLFYNKVVRSFQLCNKSFIVRMCIAYLNYTQTNSSHCIAILVNQT
jgi:hypothetical protein